MKELPLKGSADGGRRDENYFCPSNSGIRFLLKLFGILVVRLSSLLLMLLGMVFLFSLKRSDVLDLTIYFYFPEHLLSI